MNITVKIFLSALCILITVCGSNQSISSNDLMKSSLTYWDTTSYYNKKLLGKVVIYAGNDIKNNALVSLSDDLRKSINYPYVIGPIEKNEAYEIALLPGNYSVYVSTKASSLVIRYDPMKDFDVVGGETIYAKITGKEIVLVTEIPIDLKNKEKGTIYQKSELSAKFSATIAFSEDRNTENVNSISTGLTPDAHRYNKNIGINVTVANNAADPTFILNGRIIKYVSKVDNIYKLVCRFKDGDNKIVVNAVGIDGFAVSEQHIRHIKTAQEIRQEINQEQQKQITLENKAKAQKVEEDRRVVAEKAEEERKASEGDGTPDDLTCKKYGFKPLMQGYADCRMKLDLARQESLREETRNSQLRIAKEEALKQQQRISEKILEQQTIATRNRETQCLFVKAQEYARPVLGGFFQSMQNADNAYNNCMAGGPKITTTCSKDVFGNMSCDSR